MTIFFYLQERTLYQMLADALQEKNFVCSLFLSKNEFLLALENMKKKPDLLVLDYNTYNHDIFNIYNYLKEIGCGVPLIFYNDPLPKNAEARASHWFLVNNLYYGNCDEIKIENYVPVFTLISNVVEIFFSKKKENMDLSEYRDFPPKLYKTFSILQKKFPNAIRLADLQTECNIKTASSMYSLICRLKKFLKNNFHERYEIIKRDDGYVLLTTSVNNL